MLEGAKAITTIPAVSRERAKRFYSDTLGLQLEIEDADGRQGMLYRAGDGSNFMIYIRSTPTQADHTVMSFLVDDIETAVKDLRDRGVTFEEYDLPGIKTVRGIATMPDGEKAAWFKDPEGNILAVSQLKLE